MIEAARASSDLWHDIRPPNALRELPLVALRRGAIGTFMRRLPMSHALRTADICASRDRRVLEEAILPEVARRGGAILFVGVQSYTAHYPALCEAGGGQCMTLDFDPGVAGFGAAGRHATGCVTQLGTLLPDAQFTTIVMNGVLGFGVNRFSHQRAAVAACFAALAPGGVLVLGWNDRRVHAPLFEEIAAHWADYRPFGTLPPRLWVTGTDHNFAFFRARG